MPSLRLEDHIFRIMENQLRMQEILDQYTFDWNVDIPQGRLQFVVQSSRAVIADLPIQLIGSQSDVTETWLWAWANANGGNGLPESITRLGREVRDVASSNGDSLWTNSQTFPLPDQNFGYIASIIAAGVGGMFGYYRCPYDNGAAWAVIESYPEAEALPASVHRIVKAIQMCIMNMPLDHRAATIAYLGQPDDNGTYPNGLTVKFDEQNRIADMNYTLRPGDHMPISSP